MIRGILLVVLLSPWYVACNVYVARVVSCFSLFLLSMLLLIVFSVMLTSRCFCSFSLGLVF